ncbi:MAG: lysylphosphatidylglycerol synthase domain-containing protein, partial [Terriglobia bacterium]
MVLWLIATRISFTEILHAFTQVKVVYLVPVVGVLLPATVILRSVRWRWLLPAGGHLPLTSFIGAYLVGNLANSLLLGKFG